MTDARILYFDCFSGIAGDMTLGALLHLGVPTEVVVRALSTLDLPSWKLEVRPGAISGISGVDVQVLVGGQKELTPHHGAEHGGHGHGGHGHADEHGHEGEHEHGEGHDHAHGRTFAEIRSIISSGGLSPSVCALALRAFGKLAEAEGKIHGVPPSDVHFHEVGAIDAIIDIVGSAVALDHLGVDRVVSAPPPLTRGFVDCAHGRLPLPAPATLELLRGVPVVGDDGRGELITPTGAALLTTFAHRFGPMPEMVVDRIGYGLGDARWDDRPNLLRVVLGHQPTATDLPEVLIEANIDDMSPELYGPLVDGLLADGAHDVWLTPIHMKKGRPGVTLSVLTPSDKREVAVRRILRESTSIGVRFHAVERRKLEQRQITVETALGSVRVKLGVDGEQRLNAAPEFEDCRAVAAAHGVPLKEVYRLVLLALPD